MKDKHYSIRGTIAQIETKRSPGGFDKKILHLNGPTCFVEVRAKRLLEVLTSFYEGDIITVKVKIDGKVSQKSGLYYNNLLAMNINPKP